MNYTTVKILGLLLVFNYLLLSCVTIPKALHSSSERIETAAGPEDILLDTISSTYTQLLISCNDHRAGNKAKPGAIYTLNLKQVNAKPIAIKRLNEPRSVAFHPQGIDLLRQNGKVILYVVSNDDAGKQYSVLKYEFKQNKLYFLKQFECPAYMTSPNAVAGKPTGGFYVTNDQNRRHSKVQAFFSSKAGSVLYHDEGRYWIRVATELAFANGIAMSEDRKSLFVSTTQDHKVYRYKIKEDGNLINKKVVAHVQGGDNIKRAARQTITVAAHLKPIDFLKHRNDAKHLSPSVVYAINVHTGKRKVVFSDKGTDISAASAAVMHDGYLYIAQVFQPYLLKVIVPR